MDTITTRIKYLVETLAKSKAEFGRKIGISGAAVTKMYYGENIPSGSTITAICEVFGVNRAWLESGSGDVFRQDEALEAVKKSALPGAAVALVRAFDSLPESGQKAVIAFARTFVDELDAEERRSAAVPDRAEMHRLLDEELDAEEKGEAASSALRGNG